jgi:hypothetical protein
LVRAKNRIKERAKASIIVIPPVEKISTMEKIPNMASTKPKMAIDANLLLKKQSKQLTINTHKLPATKLELLFSPFVRRKLPYRLSRKSILLRGAASQVDNKKSIRKMEKQQATSLAVS